MQYFIFFDGAMSNFSIELEKVFNAFKPFNHLYVRIAKLQINLVYLHNLNNPFFCWEIEAAMKIAL